MGQRPRRRAGRVVGWTVAAVAAALLLAQLAASPVADAQANGDADRGAELYAANCAMCHGADATGMMGMHPALTGVVDRLTLEGVEVTIRNGRNTMPPMPAFAGQLTDEEIGDVIAYLDTLPPGPRNFGPQDDDDAMMPGMPEMMEEMMRPRGPDRPGALAWMLLLLVAALAVAVVVLAVAVRRRAAARSEQAPSAREILDRRYAAGELSTEEYRQRRTDLDAR